MAVYEIRVKGILGRRWAGWLGDMTVTIDPERGETILTGAVIDQAALHGLLNKIRDLGLELLTVTRLTEKKDVQDE